MLLVSEPDNIKHLDLGVQGREAGFILRKLPSKIGIFGIKSDEVGHFVSVRHRKHNIFKLNN